MSGVSRFVPCLIAGFAIFGGLEPAAADIEPCVSSAASTITVLPIKGGHQTLCQSAFGWSDTWFATTQPAIYDAKLDVLSGDNAPGLIYKNAQGDFVGSGNHYNVIAPFLDAGTLNAQFQGSTWSVTNDLLVSGNVGTSKITLGGLDMALTTTVAPPGQPNELTEQFHITNNTPAPILDLLFSDYYNFHPNGSTGPAETMCPTTTFDSASGTAKTVGGTGVGCSPIVINGTMSGSELPLTWDLGVTTDVLAAMMAASGGNYSGFNKAVGPVTGDGAVDVVWDLGALGTGQSVDFTITKNFEPSSVPEPGPLLLLGTVLLGLGLLRYRRGPRPSSAAVSGGTGGTGR